MSLQVFYFFAGVYGWIYWKRNQAGVFAVRAMPRSWTGGLILFTLLQAAVYYWLLQIFKGDRPLFDAVLTAGSLSATYMMTRKWVENWLTWVVIDGAYILLYALKAMWLFALLYLVFAAMAFYGWRKWRAACEK